jgi:hypothetical protein
VPGEAVVGLYGRVAVTLTGAGADLGVLDRRDVRTRESQPYHEAQGVSLDEAERLIAAALEQSTQRATSDLRGLVDHLAEDGVAVAAAGLVVSGYRLPATLAATLRSHPACHAAEGQMTRDALWAACDALGIEVVAVPASEGIDARVEGVGKLLGAPWRKEQKLASTAALRALGVRGSRP